MASPKETFMAMLAKKKAGAGAPKNAEGETAAQEAKDAADIKKENTPVKGKAGKMPFPIKKKGKC